MIYADNAATTKLDKDAYEAMLPFLLNEYANASQPYSFSRKTKAALKKARQMIADCINALPEEIYFTSGGTESDNWAIKGLAFADKEKRAMITSAFEHHAVLNSCAAIEYLGYPVAYMWPTKAGLIKADILEKYITNTTRLVSVMFANNEIGTVQPIKELSTMAHSYGALFHTDAVQAVGHIPIDVQDLGVDMLSASAHKFNGPKGVGFLYIRNGTSICSYLNGGSQEFTMRAGTENVAGIVGMAVALQKNCENIKNNIAHLYNLERIIVERLNKCGIDYIRNGIENGLPGLLSLSFKGCSGEQLLHRLDLQGIEISTGSACNSVKTEISHVLTAIGLEDNYAKGTIRISFGKDNKCNDAEKIINELIHVIHAL